jgi:alkylation response protein AidB-like acyl-CoA dehydrogenase
MKKNELVEKIREFTTRELMGKDDSLDSASEMPLPVYSTFARSGLANWWLPEAMGGPGVSLEESVDIVADLAYADAGAAFTLYISIIGTTAVWLYGSDSLKERWLAPMAVSGGFCATLGSERAAGSELSNMTTTVRTDGNELIVHGDKFFSTNADFADFLVVIARNDDDLGFSAVVVPRNTPGVRVIKRWNTFGVRAAGTYQVAFEACRVPADNRLDGNGLTILEAGLNPSRILIASTALGIGRRIRDVCMGYAKSKTLGERTLMAHPVFGNRIGQMESLLSVMENQCKAAARGYDALMSQKDAAAAFTAEGAMKSALVSKMFCGQAGWQIASTASELFGGLGYTDEVIIGKLLRDVRYTSIIEGGDDVLREMLYRRHVIPSFLRQDRS